MSRGAHGRRLSRWLGRSGLVLGALLWSVAPAGAAEQLAPGFGSTWTDTYCGGAAAASPDCNVTANASAATGAVAAQADLVSPKDGTGVWSAHADGYALAVAPTVHLASPVPRVELTATVYVDRATATLRTLATDFGTWQQGVESYAPYPNHWLEAVVLAYATHAQCSGCIGGSGQTVLWAGKPGTATVSGQNYVLRFTVTNPDGGNVPAGDLTIRAGIGVTTWQGDSPGKDSVGIDARVLSISRG